MRRALVFVLAVLAFGCDSAEQNPFIVRVTDINLGGSPLLADVIFIDPERGAFVPTELVPVVLTNRPYSPSSVAVPGTFALDFQVTRYEIHWRAPAGTVLGFDPTTFDHVQHTSLVVPFDGVATLAALVVPVGMKTTPPFDGLLGGGTITLVADIDIVGSPATDSSTEIRLPVSLTVAFSNYVDEQI